MSNLKWTNEVENLCENLRINCVNLSEYHRRRYYKFKSYGKYFRLPMIVLACINSTASVGLQPLLDQAVISGITCVLGLIMSIIGAIELYMGIQTSMELEMKQSKEFYTLAIDLYKMLSLRRENRGEEGKDFLNKKYAMYTKLCEASNLLKRKLKIDLLTSIPEEYEDKSRTPTPIQEYHHEQQLLAMRQFEEKLLWHQKMCRYICCCLYDEELLNEEVKDNTLYNYEFPIANKRVSKYYKPHERDIENHFLEFEESDEFIQLGNKEETKEETKEEVKEEVKEEIKEETKEETKEEVKETNIANMA
jgi:hypothetical protein